MLNVSCGIYESGHTSIEPSFFSEAWRMDMVAQVKKAVNVPVLAGGVIRHPEKAEEILAREEADLIWVGRGMLADPFWAHKAIRSQSHRIRHCISCNTCFEKINQGLHIRCAVNPRTGREYKMNQYSCLKGMKAMIAGGGPAGIQAALALEAGGCEVILMEKEDRLGGQLLIADKPPYKEKIGWMRDAMIKELEQSKVVIKLNTPWQKEITEEYKPDILVIATGSSPVVPEVDGLETAKVLELKEVLSGKVTLNNQKVLIVGGGSSGCETAEYLASDNEVTIVEQTTKLASDLENMNRLGLLTRLKGVGVTAKKGFSVNNIDGKTVYLKNLQDMTEEEITSDIIIFACGNQSNQVELESKRKIKKIYIIGDAKKPRGIMDAIYEGELTGKDLNLLNQRNAWRVDQ